ncbi:MAG: protein translocase SEC61 complex subunit gamma [Nanoarchaeota archaeon]
MLTKIKSFIVECIRVFKITKKPNKVEFLTVVKASSIGIAVIGIIGFLIFIASELI